MSELLPIFGEMSVELINCSGNDKLIAETGNVNKGIPLNDEYHINRRIRQFIKLGHESLLEFVDMHFLITAPLFVSAQWHRHRLSSFNDQSGRYTKMFTFYLPTERDDVCEEANEIIVEHCFDSIKKYNNLIDLSTPLEVARMVLPQNIMTKYHYKANLRSIFNFLSLRTDFHAQWEIRKLANEIERYVQEKFPIVHKYWRKYNG